MDNGLSTILIGLNAHTQSSQQPYKLALQSALFCEREETVPEISGNLPNITHTWWTANSTLTNLFQNK